MIQRNYRNILFISLSQYGIAFSFNFILVFLPFFTYDITPYSYRATLIWLGFIMGGPSFAAAFASTYWGSLASRFSPKVLFMGGLLSHTLIILLMGFVSSLPVLLVLRLLQGVLGGISTVGLVIVSSSTSRQWMSKDIGLFQNSLTLGQLTGPPMGAWAATMLGYKGAFISASALVFVALVFCFFYVKESPRTSDQPSAVTKHGLNRKALMGWILCFTATIQLMFLPSVLPDIFRGFHMEEATALKSAGMVVMLYTATAMAGTFWLCSLVGKFTSHRLTIIVCALGAGLQILLSLCPGITSFVAVRMLQAAMVAAVLPLVFSTFASELDGRVIGFLNSSRFAGNGLGPMIATTVLAFSNLNWIYITIGSMGLLALCGYIFVFADARDDG